MPYKISPESNIFNYNLIEKIYEVDEKIYDVEKVFPSIYLATELSRNKL